MSSQRLNLGLPLLAKELVEQASRKRTYVLRVLLALPVVGIGMLYIVSVLWDRRFDPFAILGRGGEMFEILFVVQCFGIYLLLPAMVAGVLTVEKERNTLSLLFLTRLGPWSILFEKLSSRLVPMIGFLLLCLPMMTIAYSLGGVSQGFLWGSLWILAAMIFQVGALALMCSAYFRTTAEAFIATVVIGALLYGTLPLINEWLVSGRPRRGFLDPSWSFFGPYILLEHGRGHSFLAYVRFSWTVPVSGFFFLVLARVFVIRRAFVPPDRTMQRLFGWFDRRTAAITGLAHRRSDSPAFAVNLPVFEPVAWRETERGWLGTRRHLVYACTLLSLPVILVAYYLLALLAGQPSFWKGLEVAASAHFILWILAALVVSVKAASLIASERSRQTLDVLLTTPLSGREIVRQKFRSVYRLILLFCIPLLILLWSETLWRAGSYLDPYFLSRRQMNAPLPLLSYFACCCLTLAVYLPLAGWLSLWVGLRVKSQTRAVIGAIMAVAAWCFLPVLLLACIVIPLGWFSVHVGPESGIGAIAVMSPLMVIALNETAEFEHMTKSPTTMIVINLAISVVWLRLLRARCLKRADEFLNRSVDRAIESQAPPEGREAPAQN